MKLIIKLKTQIAIEKYYENFKKKIKKKFFEYLKL